MTFKRMLVREFMRLIIKNDLKKLAKGEVKFYLPCGSEVQLAVNIDWRNKLKIVKSD